MRRAARSSSVPGAPASRPPPDPEPTPAAQAYYDRRVLARDVWDSRDAATALALTELLPPTEAVHFAQVDTAQGIWDVVVAHYSTPSFASLSRLLMPFVFPDLGSFATVSDLVTHLRSLDASFRAACTDAQLLVAPPTMWLIVHWLVTRLPDRLATARDVLLQKHPTELTIDLLETALRKIESNLLFVASASLPPPLTQCPPIFLRGDTAAVSAADCQKRGKSGKKGRKGGGGGGGGGGGAGSGGGGGGGGGAPGGGSLGGGAGQTGPPTGDVQTGGGVGPQQQQPQQHQPQQRQQHQPQQRPGSPCVCGRDDHSAARCFCRLDDLYRARWGPEATTPHWACLLARKITVFDLSMDDAHLCLSSLGACVFALGACVASTPGSPQAAASLSFTLDSGASQCFFRDHTTLTRLLAPVPVALADPSSRPAVARSSTTLPCPVVPSGVMRGLHIPSFTRNLVGVGYLQDRGITVTFVGITVVSTDAVTGRVLATFTREPRSGLYVLHTEHSPVSMSPQVVASPQVPAPQPVVDSNQVAASPPVVAFGHVVASCSCRSFTHRTVLWHHRLGHPSIPCLRTMASHRLVTGLPRVFPSLPPSPAPSCNPCVAGRLRATLHSSSLCPATAPFQTLHLDVLGPAPSQGPERERYFLVVVDDFSRYTTVFPLAKKSEVTSMLIRWLLATEGTRGRRVSCLHSDHGGEFC
ncbi:unnamed protein product [Closterium sp. NIES-53]